MASTPSLRRQPSSALATYSWNFTYDGRGRVLTSQGPRTDVNQTTTFGYFSDTDADLARAGQLQSVTDALGHVTHLASASGASSYNSYGEPLSVTDANGVVTVYTYDGRGRMLTSTTKGVSGDAQDLTQTLTYDAAGRLTTRTRPLGNGVSIGYDSADRPINITRTDSSANQYERLATAYDTADRIASRSSLACTAVGTTCGTWSPVSAYGYRYDTNGKLVEIDDPSTVSGQTGAKRLMAWTAQGQLALYDDENNSPNWNPPNVTNYGYTYDQAGRMTSEIRSGLNVTGASTATINNTSTVTTTTTTYAYDAADNVAAVVDPNGNTTTYQHDDFDRTTSETSLVSGTTTYRYDPDDNLISTTDATGATTQYTYDALDRVTRSVSTKSGAPTESVTWGYDDPSVGNFGVGRLASMSDPTGTTTYAYERRGMIAMERRALAGATFVQRYAYDGNGNRSSITYPSGRVVAFGYDYADRPYSSAIVGMVTPSLYRVASRPAMRMSPRVVPGIGVRRAGERVVQRGRMPVGTVGVPAVAGGRTVSLPSAVHAPVLPLPRLRPIASGSSKQVPVSVHPRARLDRQDVAGLAMLNRLVPLRGLSLHPSALRRSMAMSAGTPLVASTTYAPFGPMIAMSFGNGTTQSMTLDARYRPAENALLNSAGTKLADFSYTEDATGNITAIADGIDAAYSKTFLYDGFDRIEAGVEETTAAATPPPATVGVPANAGNAAKSWSAAAYVYDAMGNLLTSTVGQRAQVFAYKQNAAHQNLPLLQAVTTTAGQGTNVPAGPVSYDADGNETQVGLNAYAYSARNHLAGAYGPTYTGTNATSSLGVTVGGWQYGYDGWGQRVSTTQTPPTSAVLGGAQTRYALPGPDGMLLAESTLAPSGQGIQYEYVWMGGRPVAQMDAGGTHYTLADHLGTPILQTDASANVSWWADYEPFGSVYALRAGDTHQPLRFPGQGAEQVDTGANGATDLVYNNARWYRPMWGRYSQADPVGIDGGLNAYAYADEEPSAETDPSGLMPRLRRLPYNHQSCVSRRRTIANRLNQIADRNKEFAADKQQLPWYIQGAPMRATRVGHVVLIRELEDANAKDQAWLDKNCDDPPSGGSCPVKQPVPSRQMPLPFPALPSAKLPDPSQWPWWIWWIPVVPAAGPAAAAAAG